jgi:peptide deformylase
VQEGIILVAQAVPFDLPSQAEEARQVVRDLLEAVDRIRELHVFGKGMGVAAPQIGISRAAAVVIPPDPGADPVVLLNPRIAESSGETDEQYGLLSFRLRGLVPRSRGSWRTRMSMAPTTPAIRAGYGSAGRPRGQPPHSMLYPLA